MKNLKLHIKGENCLTAYIKVMIGLILPQLTQYVGKKIFTADGSKAKIFNFDLGNVKPVSNLEPIDCTIMVQNCYLKAEYNKLVLYVSICINGGKHENRTAFCQYFKRTIELGKLENNQILQNIDSLESIVNAYGLNKIIDLQTELVKIEKFKELEKQAEEIRRTINVDRELYKYL